MDQVNNISSAKYDYSDQNTKSIKGKQAGKPKESPEETSNELSSAVIDTIKLRADSPTDGEVLRRVQLLLLKCNDTIKGVAISQADHLSNLTLLQKEYVDRQQKVPTYLSGTSGPSDSGKTMELNNLMGLALDVIRINRVGVENEAKEVQSQLNTSKESDTAFKDLLNNLVQAMERLISQIFAR